MTAYCTSDDIELQLTESELIQVTDDSDAGVVDAAVVTRAIEDAGAEIDTWIGIRYTLPLATTPAILRRLAVDIAIYHLYCRRQGPPESRQARYDACLALLREISSGAVSIGAEYTATIPGLLSSSPARVFTRDKLSGY